MERRTSFREASFSSRAVDVARFVDLGGMGVFDSSGGHPGHCDGTAPSFRIFLFSETLIFCRVEFVSQNVCLKSVSTKCFAQSTECFVGLYCTNGIAFTHRRLSSTCFSSGK